MFAYRLPNAIKSVCFLNPDGGIRFDPPVYEQRYLTTIQILQDERWVKQLKKVIDFGCAEMKLLKLLRRIDEIEHIIEVDVDGDLLESVKQHANPLISDHLQKRENPLRVEIYQGSIDSSESCLSNTDAVICLEIIEHLYPGVLENIPYNIFGFIQPKLAIFSTPNSDFNVLLPPLSNGFRHLDHKFEWSRKQFKDWAMNICTRFPNYHFSIVGIGEPPPDYKKIGCVTQLAIFARNDLLKKPMIPEDIPIVDTSNEEQYKQIYAVDYPFKKDERTLEEKIKDEAQYHINRCRNIDRYLNSDRGVYEIPIIDIVEFIREIGGTEKQLRDILLKSNHTIENDFIIVPEYDEDDDSNEFEGLSDEIDNDGYGENFDESEDEWN